MPDQMAEPESLAQLDLMDYADHMELKDRQEVEGLPDLKARMDHQEVTEEMVLKELKDPLVQVEVPVLMDQLD
jgi:hypothetical protein